jgi:hypothetical protein
MPLTAFQTTIARLLSKNRTPDSYLAGGAALHLEPSSSRYSNDLDYFNDSETRTASAFAEDRECLEAAGFRLEVLLNHPGFIRAIVRGVKEGQATKVEWAHDSAWRFLPAIRSEVAGYQLHPVDLAINKLLALVGRDEPRDFLDIMELHQKVLSLGALTWAASGKDPGYTPFLLLDLLRRRGHVRPLDLERLALREVPNLTDLKLSWLAALDDADVFVRSRPPDQIGCLYYSLEQERFVDRHLEAPDAVPHYGRPGGILPRFSGDD